MAIIRTGPIVQAISGKVGGVDFLTGPLGGAVRTRARKLRESSPHLADARARFANLLRSWSLLDADQKAAFVAAAATYPHTNRLGQSKPISGFNLFIKLNSEWRANGVTLLLPMSWLTPIGPPTDVAVSFSAAGDYTITAETPADKTANAFWMYGWPFWKDHATNEKARLVFLRSQAAVSLDENIRPSWEAHWGPLQEGQAFAVGVAASSGGVSRRSQIILVRGLVAA